MEIYTVTRTEDTSAMPCNTEIEGSYTTRERAVEACVESIMQKVESRCDIAYGLFHDANHERLREEILSVCDEDEADLYFCRNCKECDLPEKVVDIIQSYVTGEVRSVGGYYIYVSSRDYDEFRFEIIKNNLEK